MERWNSWALGACFGIVAASSSVALAQPIVVEVNGQVQSRYFNGDAVTVNVGTITSNSVLVRIFDTAQPVSNSVGRILLSGSAAAGATGQVRLLIADASESDFRSDATLPIPAGLVNLGNPLSGEVLIVSDPNLAKRVRLSAALSGNIRGRDSSGNLVGSIGVGQIYRLDAAGAIDAHVTARGVDQDFTLTSGTDAISFVRAGGAISGNISAPGIDADGNPETLGDNQAARIAFVQAGFSGPGGINGNITAPTADASTVTGAISSIGRLYSNGPIGTATGSLVEIVGGSGIDYIGGGPGSGERLDAVPGGIYANIDARRGVPAGEFDEQLLPQRGRILQVRASGPIAGNLFATVIRNPIYGRGTFGGDPNGETFGVFAGGPIGGRVRVGAIVAASLLAGDYSWTSAIEPTIEIVHSLKGRVEATATTGRIPWFRLNPVIDTPSEEAFIGSFYPPQWQAQPSGVDEPFSRVRAHTIGKFEAGRVAREGKVYRPRIEATRIDSLNIDQYEDCQLWSGVEADPQNPTGPSEASALSYAAVGDVELNRVSVVSRQLDDAFGAELWIDSFDRLDILRDFWGRLYVSRIPADRAVRIGCLFESDRGPSDAPDIDTQIRVREQGNFDGTVILNARFDTNGQIGCPDSFDTIDEYTSCSPNRDTAWRGDIVINPPSGSGPTYLWTRLYPAPDPGQGPCYTALSSDLGGGAVGLVPYRVKGNESSPLDGVQTASNVLLKDEFSPLLGSAGPRSFAKIHFYGPVFMPDVSYELPVKVEWQAPVANPRTAQCSWYELPSTRIYAKIKRGATSSQGVPSRELWIGGIPVQNSGQQLPKGRYRATPIRQAAIPDRRLLCDGLDGFHTLATNPSVADFTYEWVVISGPEDVDSQGVPYAWTCPPDPAYVPPQDEGLANCIADVDDGSGTGTPDGGVSVEDLLYYTAEYDLGTVAADVDDGFGTGTPDGGVSIEDLLYFIYRYDAGC